MASSRARTRPDARAPFRGPARGQGNEAARTPAESLESEGGQALGVGKRRTWGQADCLAPSALVTRGQAARIAHTHVYVTTHALQHVSARIPLVAKYSLHVALACHVRGQALRSSEYVFSRNNAHRAACCIGTQCVILRSAQVSRPDRAPARPDPGVLRPP